MLGYPDLRFLTDLGAPGLSQLPTADTDLIWQPLKLPQMLYAAETWQRNQG